MLPVITRQDAMYFVANSRLYREEADPKKKEDIMEILLAQTVVRRTLGEGWWAGAAEEIDSWVKGTRRETPRVHPLSTMMTSGASREVQAETWGQLDRFGCDLLTLLDQPEANESLEAKLQELRSGSFHETWFEIAIAGVFIRKGMRARLIPSSTREKRPDIEVQGQFGKIQVECKARTRLSAEERSSEEVYRRRMKVRLAGIDALVNNALGKFQNPDSPALVAVNVDLLQTVPGTLELKLLRSNLELTLLRNPNLTGVMLLTERIDKDPASDTTGFRSELHALRGQNPTHQLPEEFFRLLVDSNTDSRPRMFYLTKYAMAH